MFGWLGNKQQQAPPCPGASTQAQRGGGDGLAARANASAMPPPGVPAGRPAMAAPRGPYPRPPVPSRSRALDPRLNGGQEVYARPVGLWQRIKDIPDDIALWMINKAMDLSIPTDDLSKYLGVGLAVMGNFILFGVKTSPDPEMKEAEALLVCGCAFLSVANFVKVLFTQKQFELVFIIHAVPNPANALMGCIVYAVVALSVVSRVIGATPVSRTASSNNPVVSPRQLAFSPEGDSSPMPKRVGTGQTPRFGHLNQRM